MEHTFDKPNAVDAVDAVPDTAQPAVVKPAARRVAVRNGNDRVTVPALPRRIATWADVVTIMRHVDALTATGKSPDAVITACDNIVTRYRVTVPTAARNTSVIDGRRVENVQNGIVTMIPSVSNIAFATACRIAFPAAVGRFTSGTWADGVSIASGIRAEWTRYGHHDPAWRAGLTAPAPAPGPTPADCRTWAVRRAAMDAGVRRNADA